MLNDKEKLAAIKDWQDDQKVHQLTCINSQHRSLVGVEEKYGEVVLKCLDCDYKQKVIPGVVYDSYMRKIALTLLCEVYKEECSHLLCSKCASSDKRECCHAVIMDSGLNLRIMADFSSNGIWDMNDEGVMVEYDDLSLPLDLRNEFEKWIMYYDTCFEKDYSTFKPNMSPRLNEWGMELAKKMKRRYPDATITHRREDENGSEEEVISN